MSAQTIADNAAAAGAGPAAALRASAPIAVTRVPDDKDMLRAAVEQTRDLLTARPAIYWPDMLGSALLGMLVLRRWRTTLAAALTGVAALAATGGVVPNTCPRSV